MEEVESYLGAVLARVGTAGGGGSMSSGGRPWWCTAAGVLRRGLGGQPGRGGSVGGGEAISVAGLGGGRPEVGRGV